MGGGRREERGREERSLCARHNLHCSSLCSWAWESCSTGATPHTPQQAGLPPPLHFLLMVQLPGPKWTVLSIILISQCFSSLFSPGSHGNPHVVVWLQCCRASPSPPLLTSDPGTQPTENPAPSPFQDPGTLLTAAKTPDLINNPAAQAREKGSFHFSSLCTVPWEYSNIYWHKVLL